MDEETHDRLVKLRADLRKKAERVAEVETLNEKLKRSLNEVHQRAAALDAGLDGWQKRAEKAEAQRDSLRAALDCEFVWDDRDGSYVGIQCARNFNEIAGNYFAHPRLAHERFKEFLDLLSEKHSEGGE